MAATGTVLLRAGNGTVTRYDLPLRPAFADAVAAGRLVVVTPDGDQADTPTPEPEAPAEVEVGGPPVKSAKVDDWRTWAISQGGDEDEVAAATKQDLIDTYGQEA